MTVNFGTVTVNPNAQAGTIISTQISGIPGDGSQFYICYGKSEQRFIGAGSYSILTNLSNIYQTNISSIGIRFTAGSGSGIIAPTTVSLGASGARICYSSGPILVELIKLANGLVAGSLSTGDMAVSQALDINGGAFDTSKLQMGTAIIESPACTPKQGNLNIPLGNYASSSLAGLGAVTEKKAVDISFTCHPNIKLQFQLSATYGLSDTQNDVMNLEQKEGAATGIGVQVFYNDRRRTNQRYNQHRG